MIATPRKSKTAALTPAGGAPGKGSPAPRERNARGRIEAAALSLFVEKGVDAATTREIAARAGISEGAIYRHFDSKDALAAELFARIHARLAALIREAARAQRGIVEQAREIVLAYCATADADFPLFAFHLLYAHQFMPTPEGLDNPVDAVVDILSAAMKRKEIARADPELVAGLALGLVLQTALQVHYGRLEAPLSRYSNDISRAVLAAIRAEKD